VDTGEDVVVVAAALGSPTQLLPRLSGSVEATAWLMLAESVHKTRRTRDTGREEALTNEQRILVMLELLRTVLRAS
jgi:hypothetical protein